VSALIVTNIGALFTGELSEPSRDDVDTIICDGGIITSVGRADDLSGEVHDGDVIVDAKGSTVGPGLIDSHCHVVLGDYTPRQKTVDFLESYTHGGITGVVSPGEIHAPGRPHDRHAVKALAVAAHYCFRDFHPGGMKVHAGSLILEPTLTEDDFAEVAEAGIRFAKFGFGDYRDPFDGEPQIRWAQENGLRVMCHSGGASIPGSLPIGPEHLLRLRPDICGHVNGGPTALPFAGVEEIVRSSDLALQLVQAGNFRSSVRILDLAAEVGALGRVVIGSDTPTGTGVMPLGVLKTIAELASWSVVEPDTLWACATGNNADVFGLQGGRVQIGQPADLVVFDAPWGSAGATAAEALRLGDIPGISAVIIDGEVCTLRSRNTPAASRLASIESAKSFASISKEP
jgi:enamidase